LKRRFVLSMIARELRHAGRRFGLYGGCMAIGIAVVVGLHALREAVDHAVDLRSRELLGADLRLESRDPVSPELQAVLDPLEARAEVPPTLVTRLGSMVLAERSGRSRLVDLLAIAGDYPLYGEVWTEPAGRWTDFGQRARQVFVDATLLIQLDARVGDRLMVGGESFEIAAAVRRAPGSFGLQAEVAPRVFLRRSDLDLTDLIQPGSLVSHLRYLKLPGEDVEVWRDENRGLLEEARMRVQTVEGYQEDLSESFGLLTRYLGLVGLAALVLGSIGVAAGVRVFVREKLDSVALLRSLGASPRDVVGVYTGLAIVLGAVSGSLGIVLCVPLLWGLPSLLGDMLPVEVEIGLGPVSVATGLALSIWATLLCALGPVRELALVAPLRALRRDFGGEATERPAARLAVPVAAGISLLAVSLWQAGEWRVGLGFSLGLCSTVGVLALAAASAAGWLRRHPLRGSAYWVRQGVANLFRPRNHTLPTTIAIGFALFVVATVHVVQRNVLAELAVDTRPDRPNMVLFDVQRDQVDPVRDLLADHEAVIVDHAPLVSARLAGVAGRRRADWLGDEALSRELRWALQREYRLTYADALRDSEELVGGHWWAPGDRYASAGPYPVSLERDLATALGVGLGDELRWLVQGVEIESYVASLRQVDWGRMATNFFVVFPPVALEDAPQSTVLLAHLAEERERADFQRDLVGRFPNVSALDATLILRSLDTMLEQIGIAIRVLSLFTLATGLAILVAAAAAARSERMRESLLLRVLGAPRRTLRLIMATEAVALALLAAGVGGLLALLSSAVVVVFVFELPFAPPMIDLLALVGATFVVTALAGALGGRALADRSPQSALREEGG